MNDHLPTPIGQPTAIGVSRRSFVGAAGIATAALAVPATAQAAFAARSLRVGVLVPEGLSYARAGESLLAGLACGFDTGSKPHTATLIPRGVRQGYAGATSATAELLASRVDVVVAGVSSITAESLAPLCRAQGVSLVVAGVGAHVVTTGTPGVVHVGLQQWQAAHAMGVWARRSLGGSLFEIVAAPDAGYDNVYATSRAFQAAGGSLLGRALTHNRPVGTGVAEAVAAAKSSGAAVVVVHASGRRVSEILSALRRDRVSAAIVADGVAMDDPMLRSLGSSAAGVHSASSWCSRADTSAVRRFVTAYKAQEGRRPDAFAAVGHDAGRVIAAAARRTLRRSGWAAGVTGRSVEGARGRLTLGDNGVVASRISIRRVVKGRNEEIATGAKIVGIPATLMSLRTTETAAYVNEYLGT